MADVSMGAFAFQKSLFACFFLDDVEEVVGPEGASREDEREASDHDGPDALLLPPDEAVEGALLLILLENGRLGRETSTTEEEEEEADDPSS